MKNSKENEDIKYSASNIANNTKKSQTSKYTCGKGGNTGGGFAAEDANATFDELLGKKVDKIGKDNSKNGADRISNGVKIQTKYCKTARATVNAAFDHDTGMFRYKVRNGRPMKLEVPRDQYDEAVSFLREKILDGKVPGVKNPDHAQKMIKKGIVSYDQSVKIAKAGRIEGILYDASTGVVSSALSAGISATITFYKLKRDGVKTKEALKVAGKQGLKSGGSVMATQVVVGQAERVILKKASEQTAKKAIEEGSKSATKGVLSSFAKSSARTNVITGVVTTVITSIPDIRKATKGEITIKECGGRIVVNSGSIATGMIVGTKCAAWGALIPIPGSSIVAGLLGGAVGSIAGTKFGNVIKDKVSSYFSLKK